MKKALKLACITCAVSLALAGCNQSNSLVSSTVKTEQAQQVKTYDAKTFFDTTSIMGSSFSPSGDKVLVSSDESGI